MVSVSHFYVAIRSHEQRPYMILRKVDGDFVEQSFEWYVKGTWGWNKGSILK